MRIVPYDPSMTKLGPHYEIYKDENIPSPHYFWRFMIGRGVTVALSPPCWDRKAVLRCLDQFHMKSQQNPDLIALDMIGKALTPKQREQKLYKEKQQKEAPLLPLSGPIISI